MGQLTTQDLLERLEKLNVLGIALSAEKDTQRLLENILLDAKLLVHADAGTLYRVVDDKLKFEAMRTDSLKIAMGGTTGATIPFAPLPLYLENGVPNNSMVVAYAVLNRKTVNITDAYAEAGFDFSGTRNFDKNTGYRSKSFLTVPMKNHENEVIGVLQLLNSVDPETKQIVAFSKEDQQLVESLASQAAVALTNRLLIDQLEELFESFINLINLAIDEKSPYTGGHCQRVPVLAMMLAESVNAAKHGTLKDFQLDEKDRYELKIAALLHDCGKVTTPVHVVDKATKLQTIIDGIELVNARFEVLKRDAEIETLHKRLARASEDAQFAAQAQQELEGRLRQLDDDGEFLRKTNVGGEFLSREAQDRVRAIGRYTWRNGVNGESGFLTPYEAENLCIARGTLSDEDRKIINYHVVATIKMLEALPWPRHLRNVPEFAGGHHERVDGKGYPKGLLGNQMSVQARILAVADVFEALTAKDRPYKPGKTLTEALTILGKMKLENHIDADLFDIFVREKVYLRYAELFLEPAQIDAVDLTKIPGYNA
ncbi:MAG: GAF and HD-GYP domain-containing protein [Burkholderiales bacterium]